MMVEQEEMVFPPHVYISKDATETSEEAAAKVLGRSGSQRRRVFDFITGQASYGATDEEIADRLGMNPSSVRPRRLELLHAELIEDSGIRRETSSQSKAIVWIKN
jgi:hypothetical protein